MIELMLMFFAIVFLAAFALGLFCVLLFVLASLMVGIYRGFRQALKK